MKIEKYDREILRMYMNLPFPSVLYDGEYEYITDFSYTLQGYCDRLLSNLSIEDYVLDERLEFSINQEFEEAIKTFGDSYELLRYYRMYLLVKEILRKHVMQSRRGESK